MRRHITSTLTAFALAGAVSVFAQEQAPAQQQQGQQGQQGQQQQQQPQSQQQQAAKETITGCVMQAKTTDGGTAYVLNNVEGGSAKMYVLGGSTQSDWQTNVNKKVEVTGPVQQPSAPPADEGAAGKPGVLRPPLMDVESVKVIADTCK